MGPFLPHPSPYLGPSRTSQKCGLTYTDEGGLSPFLSLDGVSGTIGSQDVSHPVGKSTTVLTFDRETPVNVSRETRTAK